MPTFELFDTSSFWEASNIQIRERGEIVYKVLNQKDGLIELCSPNGNNIVTSKNIGNNNFNKFEKVEFFMDSKLLILVDNKERNYIINEKKYMFKQSLNFPNAKGNITYKSAMTCRELPAQISIDIINFKEHIFCIAICRWFFARVEFHNTSS